MRELLGLLDLIKIQDLCNHKSMEVVSVVRRDKNIVIATFQVVAPSFKGLNNSQELLIVAFIADLSGDYLLREKSYGVSLTNFRR